MKFSWRVYLRERIWLAWWIAAIQVCRILILVAGGDKALHIIWDPCFVTNNLYSLGSIMDLPYVFKGDGSQLEMEMNPNMNLDAFIQQISGKLEEVLKAKFGLS